MTMRVLFTSLRNVGHFQPLVPLIEACVARGQEVAVSAPQDLQERVQKTGAHFLPFGHPGDEGLQPLWQQMREVPPSERGPFVVNRIFAGACVRAALPGLLAHIETFRPDVIVREAMEYAGLLAGQRTLVPTVRVAISIETQFEPLLDSLADALAEHRTKLGLTPDAKADDLKRERVLTQFPSSLWPEVNSQNFFRFRASGVAGSEIGPLPSSLPQAWSDGRAPLVYVTLGTVAGSMGELRDAYRLVLEAVAALPVRALLTTGDALDPSSLGPIPDNVHVERFVPQAQVLPHVRAVLCHGGSGTVLGTLAAGVPMVVLPLFADQPTNAAQVELVGAGLSVPYEGAAMEAVAHALERVMSEPVFAERARHIAEDMAGLPPVSEVPAWLQATLQG
jgi:UDP:flavonoid glycosyltransferase YjiC (YdhE family)